MNKLVLREFTAFFSDEHEAFSRASEYLKSDARKASDRKIVLVSSAIAALAGAIGYVLMYLLAVPNESHVRSAVAVGVISAVIFFIPKQQVEAAKEYLRENFGLRRRREQ